MLAPGTVLQDRYQIIRLLARGGMGAVYEARDQRLSSTVALKETFFFEEDMRRAFKREASLLAGLRHSALPKVIDHFIEGDGQFLVMEFIPGDDLGARLLRQGIPFPLADVVNWGDQLLSALEYLHSHEPPIIHRDIKPQNLKLTERGDVILLDFGLAKGAGTTTPIAMSVRGYTLNYAPLEQIRGLGTNPRSDLYSLAATLYHLMTGVAPPDALTRVSGLVSNQPDPLVPADQLNPPVPIAIARVLESALSQDPEQRPANATRMRAALREAAAAGTQAASTVILGSMQATVRGSSPATAGIAATPTAAETIRIAAPDSLPAGVATTPESVAQNKSSVFAKPRRPLIIGAAALAVIAVVALVYFLLSGSNSVAAMDAGAASSDRSKPTPLAAKIILGGTGTEERYFTFTAKRGELTLVLDALATGSSVTVELFDNRSNNLRFESESNNLSVTSNTHIEEAKARVLVEREGPLLLRIVATYPKELRVYRLRIDGDVGLAGGWSSSNKGSDALAAYLTDRDNPLALASNKLLAGGTTKDLYYRFTAGPGELKLTLNVIGTGGSIGIEFFNANAKPLRFENGQNFSVTGDGHDEQAATAVLLEKRQPVLMRITNAYPNETRAFRLRFEGPVESAAARNSEVDPVSAALEKQFTDRDNPTELTSNELSGRGSAKDLYYSFTGGPGEVNLSLEVAGAGSMVTVEMFDKDGARLPLDGNRTSIAVTSSGEPVEQHARLSLAQEAQVLMRVSQTYPNELRSFRLRLNGAAKLEGASKIEETKPPAADKPQPASPPEQKNERRQRPEMQRRMVPNAPGGQGVRRQRPRALRSPY